jgi:hypothetical protein
MKTPGEIIKQQGTMMADQGATIAALIEEIGRLRQGNVNSTALGSASIGDVRGGSINSRESRYRARSQTGAAPECCTT